MAKDAARATRLDAALIHAVISAESGYNPFARSRKGAAGWSKPQAVPFDTPANESRPAISGPTLVMARCSGRVSMTLHAEMGVATGEISQLHLETVSRDSVLALLYLNEKRDETRYQDEPSRRRNRERGRKRKSRAFDAVDGTERDRDQGSDRGTGGRDWQQRRSQTEQPSVQDQLTGPCTFHFYHDDNGKRK